MVLFFRSKTNTVEQITDAILREAQRKLDLVKKRGATGVGWTRPSPPASAQAAAAAAAAPSPARDIHRLHEPAYSDDHKATSFYSPAGERDHRRHEDVHGSDAPPVQAALRGGGGGAQTAAGSAEAGGGGRRLGAAKDGRYADGGSAAAAAEGIFGLDKTHASGSGSSAVSPRSAPRVSHRSAPRIISRGRPDPVFNTDRSERILGDLGVVVPAPATVTGSTGKMPSFGVDMTALSGDAGGSAEKVAVVRNAGATVDKERWAPTPSPLIFGSHSIDAAARDGKSAAGSGAAAAGARVGGGGVGGDHRGEHASSLGPATPVSPSKGPPPFTGGIPRRDANGERPSHVWPPKAAAAAAPAEGEAVQEHVYDSEEDAAMPPVMVPLHRMAQANITSTSSFSVDSSESASAGGRKDGNAAPGVAAAKRSTPQKQKLGGKAEYAMLFSGGNE